MSRWASFALGLTWVVHIFLLVAKVAFFRGVIRDLVVAMASSGMHLRLVVSSIGTWSYCSSTEGRRKVGHIVELAGPSCW
eukprot:811826-Amphidinium_carterae.1